MSDSEVCQRCNRDYPVWFAPSELWNQVVRDGRTRGGELLEADRSEHFLCPTCFMVLAHERGAISQYTAFKVGSE